jgi:hypothetical protein
MNQNLPQVGKMYSAVEKGREVFTGTCTKVAKLRDSDDALVRLETKHGYYTQRLSAASFVDPKDAPKERILSAKEREAQILQKF